MAPLLHHLAERTDQPGFKLLSAIVLPVIMAIGAAVWITFSIGLQTRQTRIIEDNFIVRQSAAQAAEALKLTADQTAKSLQQKTEDRAELASITSQAKLDVAALESAAKARYEANLARINEVVSAMGEVTKRQQELTVFSTETSLQIRSLTASVSALVEHSNQIDKSIDRHDRELEQLRMK